jgi:K+-sensing histidine kinase KdpD
LDRAGFAVGQLWRLGRSIIVAVTCLNYFFVPPLFEFRVDDPEIL